MPLTVAWKTRPGRSCDAHLGGLAFRNRRDVCLGHVDEDAHGIDLRDLEHLLRSGVDERADVDEALGYDSVERRGHARKQLHLFEAAHGGLVGVDGVPRGGERGFRLAQLGFFYREIGGARVRVLLRDDALRLQPDPAFGGYAREVAIGARELDRRFELLDRGLGLFEVRVRLAELLIDFGRLDLRHQLSGSDVPAEIDQPGFQVAIGAREDRGFDHGLQVAREIDGIGRGGEVRGGDEHDGAAFREFVRGGCESLLTRESREQTGRRSRRRPRWRARRKRRSADGLALSLSIDLRVAAVARRRAAKHAVHDGHKE